MLALQHKKLILVPLIMATLSFSGLLTAGTQAAEIDPQLLAAMQTTDTGKVNVIIRMAEQVDLEQYRVDNSDKAIHDLRRSLIEALRKTSSQSQSGVLKLLSSARADKIRQLWLINAVAASLPAEVVAQIAQLPGVGSINLDGALAAPVSLASTAAPAEWNLSAINADLLWADGYTGQGAVVAGIGTGVDNNHQDLAANYRGGRNSWFDPNDEHNKPYDANGHGTQSMALMVGGNGSGTAIGVAPGAQWIAAKVFNDAGTASYSAIHLAFQWLLDPDGRSNTDDAPDVVNGSWGFDQLLDQCFAEFQADVQALKSFGIAAVFSAGNSGPAYSTSISPANYPESVSVGAVDQNLSIASFSSAGPSACGGGTYPTLVAPGMFVKTADLTFGGIFPNSYTYVSGTSFAAPHVAASYALLKSAFPAASLIDLENALQQNAVDLLSVGPDNDSGYGLVDVASAYAQLLNGGNCASSDPACSPGNPPIAMDDSASTDNVTTITIDVLANDSYADGDPLSVASLDTSGTNGSVSTNGSVVSYTPSAGFVGTDSFSYMATDGNSTSNVATVTITVTDSAPPPNNQIPTASNGNETTKRNQAISIDMIAYASDPDGSIASVCVNLTDCGNPSAVTQKNGTLMVSGTTVTYTPTTGFTGRDSFSYKVFDNAGAESNTADIRINVKRK